MEQSSQKFDTTSGSIRSVTSKTNALTKSVTSLSPRKQSSKEQELNNDLPKHILERKRLQNVQKTMHRTIIDLGDNLHQTIVRNLDDEYETRLRQKEEELIEKFKKQKQLELNIERENFERKIDAIKNQLKSEYERLLKEKVLEIEIYTQNIAKEQIETNKKEAKKYLEETVEQLKLEFDKEKRVAVERAIQNERQVCSTKLDEQKKNYEKKIDDLNEEWMNNMNISLQDLRHKLVKETDKSVQLAIDQTKSEESAKRDKCIEGYEIKLDRLKEDIQNNLNVISQLNSRISSLQYENQELKSLLDELRGEFQKFVEQFSHMKHGEADFLFIKHK